jgi:hypothetical protein
VCPGGVLPAGDMAGGSRRPGPVYPPRGTRHPPSEQAAPGWFAVTTQDVVREAALRHGWTWRTSRRDALEVAITKPGVGEAVVRFSAGGAIRSARTSAGEITGKRQRDQLVAFLGDPSREVSRG